MTPFVVHLTQVSRLKQFSAHLVAISCLLSFHALVIAADPFKKPNLSGHQLSPGGGSTMKSGAFHKPMLPSGGFKSPVKQLPSFKPHQVGQTLKKPTGGLTLPTSQKPVFNPNNPGFKNPIVTKPGVFNLGIVKPGVIKPGVIKPGVIKPGVFDPVVVKPGIVKPGAINPGIFNPGGNKPGSFNPGIVKPKPDLSDLFPGGLPPKIPIPGNNPGNDPGNDPGNNPPQNPPADPPHDDDHDHKHPHWPPIWVGGYYPVPTPIYYPCPPVNATCPIVISQPGVVVEGQVTQVEVDVIPQVENGSEFTMVIEGDPSRVKLAVLTVNQMQMMIEITQTGTGYLTMQMPQLLLKNTQPASLTLLANQTTALANIPIEIILAQPKTSVVNANTAAN